MPIYEYQCQSCGHKLEKLQRMNDQPLTNCPDCHATALRRLVSASAFRLKGGGWYETDFKKDGKKNLHDSGSSGDSAGSAGSGGGDSAKAEPSAKKEVTTTTETKKTETKPAASKSDSA